jgi:hypothetical protein
MANRLPLKLLSSPLPLSLQAKEDDRLWLFPVPPKNIYVAAPLPNQGKAARFALQLQDAGFTVTSSWLRKDFSDKPTSELSGPWIEYESHWGNVDVEDVLRSDTVVLLSDEPSSSGGYHVELGIAIGRGVNVVAVGGRPNVFFWTKEVRYASKLEGLVEWLGCTEHGQVDLPPPPVSKLQEVFNPGLATPTGNMDLRMQAEPELVQLGMTPAADPIDEVPF